MGLGKTIQVLSLLLVLQAPERAQARTEPAGGSGFAAGQLGGGDRTFRAGLEGADRASVRAAGGRFERRLRPSGCASVDLVITSYGSLLRMPWIAETPWRLVVLDEAQAIKNPDAKQTRAVKKLKARARLALTGTPVENRLGDLWSIFDFVNPGLLGSAKEFTRFRQTPGRAAAQLLWSAARTGAALYFAAAEDG